MLQLQLFWSQHLLCMFLVLLFVIIHISIPTYSASETTIFFLFKIILLCYDIFSNWISFFHKVMHQIMEEKFVKRSHALLKSVNH